LLTRKGSWKDARKSSRVEKTCKGQRKTLYARSNGASGKRKKPKEEKEVNDSRQGMHTIPRNPELKQVENNPAQKTPTLGKIGKEETHQSNSESTTHQTGKDGPKFSRIRTMEVASGTPIKRQSGKDKRKKFRRGKPRQRTF